MRLGGDLAGCRLGKRALKFRDWGKMAATFIDLDTQRAIRIVARESSKDPARQLHPEMESKNLQQMAAYRELRDEDLFEEQWVTVELDAEEFPGYKGARVVRHQCGEGINYDRFVVRNEATLCLSCAQNRKSDTTGHSPRSRREHLRSKLVKPGPSPPLVRPGTSWIRRSVWRLPAPRLGRPSRVLPQGTEMPQMPARLAVTV